MTDSTTPLGIMTQRGPTALWNDSATKSELATSISWGAVGATCNPVIALSSIRSDLPRWAARIAELGHELPEATCLLYTSPSPRDRTRSRMPSSA